jgi:hypothetical protein
MEVLIGLLALVGLGTLGVLVMSWYERREEPPRYEMEEADLVAPYREGLHAAMRMQAVAQDLEQQLYAEAAQHLDVTLPPEPGQP